MPVKIKVCGVASGRSLEELDGLVDYIGFVSSRAISSGRTLPIEAIHSLASRVSRSRSVAVLHEYSPREIVSAAQGLSVDIIQIHKPLSPSKALPLALALEPFGVRLAVLVERRVDGWSPEHPCSYLNRLHSLGIMDRIEYVLMDLPKNGSKPATIVSTIESSVKQCIGRLGIAGGITPETSCMAASFNPLLIDVSRGVEVRPGVKSVSKVVELIHNARRCSERWRRVS